MSKKESFTKIIDYVFENEEKFHLKESFEEIYPNAKEYWDSFKSSKEESDKKITENGKKVLIWMKDNIEKTSNLFTSKEIAEGLFTSGRSVAGAMKKLVADEYVEKQGKDPIKYSLTENGKNLIF